MGNCSFKSTTTGECYHSIRVLSDSGDILQFKGPITVGQVLQHYPGYGIFLQGHASIPLAMHKSLSYGLLHYLLPLKEAVRVDEEKKKVMRDAACDYVEKLSNESAALEVLPSAKNGVWRVKLMIDTRQLEEILSEQVNTEALIEKMRMAATTCSTTSPTRSSRIMTTWKMGLLKAMLHSNKS
ncbi:hypothetical protein Lal_00016576 [Lupinus albus]|uniref:Uncharacterized protein n=1 Tax=Lupinus albus TaxID=3870 RepID=A0A6A5MIH4_LUPAL|nr:hypothetical protein Lalb_Chr05g0224011 [Lupinus albus]KAF1872739.1 hypothetical protein Lal_00016576 [Lupinus albus]